MGKLKDWLMQQFGDVPEPGEGPTDADYYAYLSRAELDSERPAFDTRWQRFNAETRDEEEVF